MLANRLLRRRGVALAASATSAIARAAGVSLSTPATAQSTDNGTITYQVHPFAQKFDNASASALPDTATCIAKAGLSCYTPAQIRAAYDIPASWTGAGEKIAIIDAYGSPTVQSDLDTFDKAFGLKDTTVNVVCPMGCPDTMTAHTGQPGGWAGETSLDVQWAHAIAPDAQINLVVAPNNYGNALNNAVQYAVDHKLGDVLSMSYGSDESAISGGGNNSQLMQAHQAFQDAVNAGISLFASSGDYGATDASSTITAGYPSSDPLVTAVGGTDLFLGKNGGYGSETVWNDTHADTCPFGCTRGAFGATGGAESSIFQAPSYQQGVTGYSMRTPSDVAYNASVYTGVWVYLGFMDAGHNGFYFMGGTSSGSPQWAAIGALADQQAGHDLGQLNPKLYSLAGGRDFHDVTVGNNAWNDQPGYSGGSGYDVPTGLGSPDVRNLVPDLVAAASGSGSSPHNNR